MSKKILNGKVIGDKNNKTVIVLVKRRYAHPFFGKVITSSKKYHAHDENNKFKVGDDVKIIESKPFSKKKMGGSKKINDTSTNRIKCS